MAKYKRGSSIKGENQITNRLGNSQSLKVADRCTLSPRALQQQTRSDTLFEVLSVLKTICFKDHLHFLDYLRKGFIRFSLPMVVSGPWPVYTMVCSSKPRSLFLMLAIKVS